MATLTEQVIEEAARKILRYWGTSRGDDPSPKLVEMLVSRVHQLSLCNFFFTYPLMVVRLILSMTLACVGIRLATTHSSSVFLLAIGMGLLLAGVSFIVKVLFVPTKLFAVTKIVGWRAGTILVRPGLDEAALAETLIHEFIHLMPVLGLASPTSPKPLYGGDREEIVAAAAAMLSLLEENKIDLSNRPDFRAGANLVRLDFTLRERFSNGLIRRGLCDADGERSEEILIHSQIRLYGECI